MNDEAGKKYEQMASLEVEVNEAVQHILDNYGQEQGHKLETAIDKVGLPLEHPLYASKKCRECSGRGVVTRVVSSDGYKQVWEGRTKRVDATCACVHRGYSKLRLKIEAAKVANGASQEDTIALTRATYPDLFK